MDIKNLKWGNKQSEAMKVKGGLGPYKDEKQHVQYDINTSSRKIVDMNLGDTVVFTAAEAMTHMIVTKKVRGLEDTKNAELKDLLERSEFYKMLPKAEIKMSLTGTAGYGIVDLFGKDYITLVNIFGFRNVGTLVLEAYGVTDNVVSSTQAEFNVSYHWFYENNQPFFEVVGYNTTNGKELKIKGNEKIPLDPKWKNEFPIQVFNNLENSQADFQRAYGIYESLNFYSNKLKDVWEITKGVNAFQKNFTGNLTSSDAQEKILSGDWFLDFPSYNSRYGNAIEPLQMQSNALPNNMILIDTLEDKLNKYMFALRDSISSGTNKHNTEVATFNQLATDTVEYKIERFRNREYTMFFRRHVGKIIKGLSEIDIRFDISNIEKYKLEAMKAAGQKNNAPGNQKSAGPKGKANKK